MIMTKKNEEGIYMMAHSKLHYDWMWWLNLSSDRSLEVRWTTYWRRDRTEGTRSTLTDVAYVRDLFGNLLLTFYSDAGEKEDQQE